jgi:hypothetical protein
MAINIEQIFERDVAQLRGPTRLIVSRLRAAKMELPQKTVEHLVAAAMESKHVIGVDQRTGVVQGWSFSVIDDRERCKEGMFGWVPFGFEDDLGPLDRSPAWSKLLHTLSQRHLWPRPGGLSCLQQRLWCAVDRNHGQHQQRRMAGDGLGWWNS